MLGSQFHLLLLGLSFHYLTESNLSIKKLFPTKIIEPLLEEVSSSITRAEQKEPQSLLCSALFESLPLTLETEADDANFRWKVSNKVPWVQFCLVLFFLNAQKNKWCGVIEILRMTVMVLKVVFIELLVQIIVMSDSMLRWCNCFVLLFISLQFSLSLQFY